MPAESPARDFQVRPSTPQDAPALNALYRRVSGRVRTLEQWRWEWLDTPTGRAPSWVIVASASGDVVGHHGLIEMPLCCGQRVLRAARTDNTMVDPDLRTTLYYPAFEAQLFKQYREHYDVVFTAVAGEVLAAMRRRLGYRVIGNWVEWVVADSLAYRAARSLGRTASRVANAFSNVKLPRAGDELVVTGDLERIEHLWRASLRSDALTPERSAAYLSWRLASHAWHRYTLALLVRDGADFGFVAWRERDAGGGATRVLIHDAFTRSADDASCRELLTALAWHHRDAAARVQIRTLDVDTPLARAARSLAPERAREPAGDTLLLAWSANAEQPVWDVTTLVDAGI